MKEQILKLRKDGKTYNEIQKIVGCAKSTISFHCKKEKEYLIIEDSNKEETNKVINLRLDNLTYLEIWEKLERNISKEKIRKICNKNNLSFLDRTSNEEIEEIKFLYEKLGSYKKVAKELGYSNRTVRNYVEINTEKLTESQLKSHRSKSVIDWRNRKKIELVEYKGGVCVKCGYNKCLAAMEFHHLDPNEKDFTISGKSWSFDRLKKEVDKCILVCNRCHTEIHYLKE